MCLRLRPRCIVAFKAALLLVTAVLAAAQDPPHDAVPNNALGSLRLEIQELRQAINEMRDQLAASHRESEALRRDLQLMREQLAAAPTDAKVKEQVALLEEQQQVISAKVDEQAQSKVASGSKYHVHLSGMVLFNAAGTRGSVDHIDIPTMALPQTPGESGGSIVESVRQSVIGLEVFGPSFYGAKTSGSVQFDFFGGFPASSDGLSSGLLRMRTARIALDWKNTSLVAGQEAPFFSPLSPTSLVSAAYPVFSSAGNLWTWTPQVYAENRVNLSDRTRVTLQGGILDPFTGELPASEYSRFPTAGERTRSPAFAARAALQRLSDTQGASIGAGVYFARQDWGFHRIVDGWAAMADWDAPLGRWFNWSGELYRGKAIGGLGGGPNASVLFSDPVSPPRPLDSAGGWSQLKFQPLARWQLNAAFGEDYTFPNKLGDVAVPYIRRNASAMVNVIYQARSNLLFSTEYRHLWTLRFPESSESADHVSVGAGVRF